MRNQIFISYSHKDPVWLEKFQTNLKPYLYQISSASWDDQKIGPGTDWYQEIERALAAAKVAVLLVSSDFLASDFITQKELPYLFTAADKKEVIIFPVAVRHSVWRATPLKDKQFVNDPKTPLEAMEKAQCEGEVVRICELIAEALHETVSAPPPPGPPGEGPEEKEGRKAEEGLQALVDLMYSPDVMKRVNSFNTVFQLSSKQIELLVNYKDLHDLLHNLQFQCYNTLMSVVRKASKYPDDRSVWNDAVENEDVFEAVSTGLKKAAAQTTYTPTVLAWVKQLSAYLDLFFQAVADKDPAEVLKRAEPIRAILAREPTRINDRLVTAAETLPLPDLVAALTGVLESLNGSKVNPIALRKFEEGVRSLDELGTRLNALVSAHNTWQEIDIDLRRVEGSISEKDYGDLTNSWGDLKPKIEEECAGFEEEWADRLLKSIAALDKALEAGEPNDVVLRFQTFRTRASRRFYQVDFDLKSLCEKLRKIGEPLTTVLEMISQ